MKKWLAAVSVLLVAGAAWAGDEFEVRGRLQTALEARQWHDREGDESGWISRFRLQRVRVEGRWQPASWARLVLELEGAGELGFTDRYVTDDGLARQRVREQFALQLRDAYGHFEILPGLELRAGQFKKPFSRLRLTSPFDLLLPERGLLDRFAVEAARYGGYGGRAVGVMAGGRFKELAGLRYSLGVFSSPRFAAGGEQSAKDYVGRLEARPLKGARLALNASHKIYHYREGPTLDGLALRRGHAYTGNLFGADAAIKIKKLTLFLEGACGDNVDYGPGHRLWGAHLIAAYRLKIGGEWEFTPAVMSELFDPSDREGHGPLLRLAAALNVDPRPWLRLTLHGEWTRGEMWRWDEEAGQGFGGYNTGPVAARLMLQLAIKL